MTVNIVEGSIIDIDNEVFLLISHSSRKHSSIFINTCAKLVLLFGIGVRTSCNLQSADIPFRGNPISRKNSSTKCIFYTPQFPQSLLHFWSDVCKQISADYLLTMCQLFYTSNDVSLILLSVTHIIMYHLFYVSNVLSPILCR